MATPTPRLAQPADRTAHALAPPPQRGDNPLTRSLAGVLGLGFLGAMLAICLLGLFWTLAPASPTYPGAGADTPRYNAGSAQFGRLPPWWAVDRDDALRLNTLVPEERVREIADRLGVSEERARSATDGELARAMRDAWPYEGNRLAMLLGTDVLGRSLLYRVVTGGGISLGIGLAAALISVFIGTLYGAVAGYAGGKTDAAMMRIVDVLFGLPYILLVVLLAVASDAALDEYLSRQKARASWVEARMQTLLDRPGVTAQTPADFRERAFDADGPLADMAQDLGMGGVVQAVLAPDDGAADGQADGAAGATATNADVLAAMALRARPPRTISPAARMTLDVVVLLVAIGGVSWLTMARVIRGQVLSLKGQPFIESARSIGSPLGRIFGRHLLPNLLGPIIVYATLTVPLAILQESFLSFLGIGVKPPLPSWGNLAADGLNELNPYKSLWWLILFPCLLLGTTLLALNFVGEGLREAFDPKRARR